MLTGRCLCGRCSYEIDGAPLVVAHCHCRDCQRLSGAGHATGAMFAMTNVRIAGSPATYAMQSAAGNTVTRVFCAHCGSPLFGRNTGMPGFTTVTAGTLDNPDLITPQVAVFARSRRHWDVMDSSLASFDGQPEWKPADDA